MSARGLTRREFLGSTAGFVSSLSLSGLAGCSTSDFARRPNFLILLTDQERYPIHWPEGWKDQHMASWSRLREHGMTFHRAYTAASQCSPSRACLLTGEYSNVNGMPSLVAPVGLAGQAELPNIASVLRDRAGYDVVWKGKWHLSFPLGFTGGPPSGEVWTVADIAELEKTYGMKRWDPPEAGNNAFNSAGARATLGGGTANNDGRYVQGATPGAAGQTPGLGESVLDYVARVAATPPVLQKPFCLFVSLVNPHDIAFYPNGWDQAGYRLEDFDTLPIDLPSNYEASLDTKPGIQGRFRAAYDQESPLPDDTAMRRFVRFYAYLHQVVEPHIQAILDALDQHGLTEETIIIRTADHGEMGLSHGLREKAYTAYEEMIHIPLVISNPKLFPEPQETQAFYSHVDLLATVADLAGAAPVGVGTSLVPVLRNPNASVQDAVLFTYDDNFVLGKGEEGSHIRALREKRWTYAVYYSADGSLFEFELYDNEADPGQLENLLHNPASDILPDWRRLHLKLTSKMEAMEAVPSGFAWPASIDSFLG